jgi:hypothetical protein
MSVDEERARKIVRAAQALTRSMRDQGFRPADMLWLIAFIVYEFGSMAQSHLPEQDNFEGILIALSRRVELMRGIGVMNALASIDEAEAAFGDIEPEPADTKRGEE